MGQLQKKNQDFQNANINLVAVTVDPPKFAKKVSKQVGLEYPVVVDQGGAMMDLFGIRHKGANPMDGSDIPRSASILLGRDGKILWSHFSENYRIRPSATEVLAAAKEALGSGT